MEDLFLHEAIPGHHFQISIQQEQTGLPMFRRFGGYTAYVEGYAPVLRDASATSSGMYTDPYQEFGQLQNEQFRAMRLVVDTGLHTKGWTREQAIKYMLDNSAMSETDVTAEVERYIAMPGQALAYKTGQMKITELRAKAAKELGSQVRRPRLPHRGAQGRCAAAGGAGRQDRPVDCRAEALSGFIATRKDRLRPVFSFGAGPGFFWRPGV